MKIPENFKTFDENINISFLITFIARMHREFHSEYATCKKLTKGEFPYLMLLYFKKEKSQKEIAETFCYTESNVAKSIRNLEDKGFVERIVDDNNRRKKIVSLTEKGKKICEEIFRIENEWESIITEKYDEEELKFIKESLCYMLKQSITANENKYAKKRG